MPDQPTTHYEFHAAMREGDERLREHIDQQIEQVNSALSYSESQIRIALEASERLELERTARISEIAAAETHRIAERLDSADTALREHILLQREQMGDALKNIDEQTARALASSERVEQERVDRLRASTEGLINSLENRVREGDHRLTAHIAEQIGQIKAALEAVQRETAIAHEAARELEVTRVAEIKSVMDNAVKALESRVDDRVNGAQREVAIAFEAAQTAIAKSEEAYERRFASVNEFRAELSDRWSQAMPREVAETQYTQINERVRTLELSRSSSTGSEIAQRRAQDRAQPWMIWVVGAILTLVIVAVNLVAAQ